MSRCAFGAKPAHAGSGWTHRVESEYVPCYPEPPLPRAFLVGLAILTLFGLVLANSTIYFSHFNSLETRDEFTADLVFGEGF